MLSHKGYQAEAGRHRDLGGNRLGDCVATRDTQLHPSYVFPDNTIMKDLTESLVSIKQEVAAVNQGLQYTSARSNLLQMDHDSDWICW